MQYIITGKGIVSVGKVGLLKKMLIRFSLLKSCYHSLDDVYCARRVLFISCMLFKPLLQFPSPSYCAHCWSCDAVNILNQVIVCVEIRICVIKKTVKYNSADLECFCCESSTQQGPIVILKSRNFGLFFNKVSL